MPSLLGFTRCAGPPASPSKWSTPWRPTTATSRLTAPSSSLAASTVRGVLRVISPCYCCLDGLTSHRAWHTAVAGGGLGDLNTEPMSLLVGAYVRPVAIGALVSGRRYLRANRREWREAPSQPHGKAHVAWRPISAVTSRYVRGGVKQRWSITSRTVAGRLATMPCVPRQSHRQDQTARMSTKAKHHVAREASAGSVMRLKPLICGRLARVRQEARRRCRTKRIAEHSNRGMVASEPRQSFAFFPSLLRSSHSRSIRG